MKLKLWSLNCLRLVFWHFVLLCVFGSSIYSFWFRKHACNACKYLKLCLQRILLCPQRPQKNNKLCWQICTSPCPFIWIYLIMFEMIPAIILSTFCNQFLGWKVKHGLVQRLSCRLKLVTEPKLKSSSKWLKLITRLLKNCFC